MNHPFRDEWMSYLYDELTGEQHATLAAHLAVCPECKAKLAEWRGLKKDLDAWQLAAKPARVMGNSPWIRWAAAAVLLLGVGVGVGRYTMSASADPEKLRAEIEPSIRQQLRQEFSQLLRDELEKSASSMLTAANTHTEELVGDLAKAYKQNRADDNQAVYEALSKLNSQTIGDLAEFKKELDTVALYSEAGFNQTHRQLLQLAGYTQPAGNLTDSPQN